ncbi:MAG: ABC transporter permease [Clostridium sp.]|nr:ABC transporter permease [Clostridium sp.]
MKYFLKKLMTLIITLLLISFLSFTAFSVIPGDAALSRLGKDATEEQIENLREEIGLNDSLPERYGRWLSGAVQGDFGESYRYQDVSVRSLLADRLPVTVLLAVISLAIILVCAIPLGILCARFSGSFLDLLINQITQVLMAVPAFFLGIILTYVFGLILHFFQPGNFTSPTENLAASAKYLFFPALAVALPKIAMVVKFLRNSVISEMSKDYVRTARSKGNTETAVLYGHVLKNAMIPVVTFLAMVIAEILAGSIVVEQVFSVPGIGRLLISSISTRDYPVVQAIVLYVTAVVVIINFIVDVLYQFLDPRVKTI